MSNIIVSPTSGVIEFNTGDASGASFYTSTAPIRLDATGGNSWLTGTKVGIGLTDPSKKLEVLSDDNAFMTEVIKVSSNNEAQYTALGYSNLMASHELSLFTLSSQPISFRPNSVEKMHLTAGGNLGIGTDSPNSKLHVSAGSLEITSGSHIMTNGYSITWGTGNASKIYAGDGVQDMAFTAGSTEAMRINGSSQNVGIGTNNPLYKLDVSGTIAGTSGNFVSGITIGGNPVMTGTSDTDVDTLQTVTDRGNLTTTSIVSSGPHISGATGLFGVAVISNFNASDYAAFGHEDAADNSYAIRQQNNSNTHINAGSSRNIEFRQANSTQGMFTAASDFFIGPNSTSNTLFVDVSETSVGIGTYAPDAKLHIRGALPNIYLEESDATSTFNITDFQLGGGALNINTRQSNGSFVSTDYQIAKNANGATDHKFFITGSEKVRIDSNGAVGIGTASPIGGYSLNVTGDIFVGDNSAGAVGRNFVAYSASLGVGKNSVATIVGKSVKASSATNNSLVTLPYSTDGTLWYKQSYAAGHTWHRTTGYATSTTISESEGELMRLTTGGNVGIGTNAPAFRLDVRSADDTLAYFKSSDNKASIYIADNDSAGYVSAENGYMSIGPHGGLNTGNININLSEGNVGINTKSPEEKLHVGGDIRVGTGGAADYNRVEFTRYGGAIVGGIGWHSDSIFYVAGHPSFGPTAGNDVRVYGFGGDLHLGDNANGDVLTIDYTNGDVGIGTAAPSGTLHILGGYDSNNPNTLVIAGRENASTVYGGIQFERAGGTTFFGIGNDSRTDRDELYLGGGFGGVKAATAFRVFTEGPYGSTIGEERLTIVSGGNVGIGSNDPVQKLTIAGGDIGIGFNQKLILRSDDVGASYLTYTNVGGQRTLLYGYYGIEFATQNGAALNILQSNNVGIGTATPYGQLDIFSSNNTETDPSDAANYHLHLHNPLDDTSESIGIGFGLTSDHDAVGAAIAHERKGSNSYGDLYFSTRPIGGSVTERLRITATGNVGIGTDNPDRKVVIDAGAGYPLKVNATQDYMIGLARNGTEQWWFKVNTAGDFTIHENAADDRFRIKAGGNVGIGTTNPATLLQVSGGDITIQGADGESRWFGFTSSASANTYVAKIESDHAANWGGNLKFFTGPAGGGNAERMRIAGDGDVGIGTPTPNAKLDVRGDISGSGNFYGTGVGSRITNNGTPYLLSGDAAAALTLQDVTDNGATTTNALKSQLISITGGGYSSPFGVNGLHLMFDGTGNAYINAQHNGTSNRHLTFNAGSYNFNLGNLAVDTDTLYVNASTDRVGINEDSVDATLHLTNVAGGVVNQKFERAGVSAWRLGIPTGQTYFAIDDSSDDLSTPEMVITTAGDVVIGTNANFPVVGTTPSGKLDIRGTSDGQLAFDIDGGSSDIKSAYNLELWADYDANNSAGYKNIYLKTNGDNTRMFISGDGKVGVGTTRPQNNFHVRSESDGDWVARISNSEATAGRSYGLKVDGGSTSADIGFEVANYDGDVGLRVRGDANVGIGTYDIDQALSLSGAIDFQAKAYTQNAATMGLFTNNVLYVKGGTAGLMLQNGDGSDSIAMIGSYMSFSNNAGETMRLTHDKDVGIGTAAPAAKLDVRTASQGDTAFKAGYGSHANLAVGTSTSFTKLNIASGNYHHSFLTRTSAGASSERFVIEGGSDIADAYFTNCNVGIGTNAPSQKLNVSGGHILIDHQDPQLMFNDIGGSTYTSSWMYKNNAISFVWGGGHKFKIDSAGGATLGQSYSSSETAPSKGIITEGKVGLGTTNPTATLHVADTTNETDGKVIISGTGTSTLNSDLYVYGSGNGDVINAVRDRNDASIKVTSTTAGAYFRTNSAASTFNGLDLNSNWFIGQYGHNDLRIVDGTASAGDAAAALTVQNTTKNVGIGITSPTEKLDVSGAINIQDGYSLRYNNSSNISIVGSSSLGLTYTAYNQHFKAFNGSSYTEYMTIATGGNIGIGTDSPNSKLEVDGEVRITSSAAYHTHLNYDDAGNNFISQANGGFTQFRNSAGTLMQLRSNGSLGIGAKAPSTTLLAVSGAISDSLGVFIDGDDGVEITTRGSLRQQIDFLGTNTSAINAKGSLWINYDTNNDGSNDVITFARNAADEAGTVDMVITEGKVGIGTDTPSYDLDVIGTTRSTYYIGGAYFEENASDSKIKFYPNGTVLVLDEEGSLKPCEKENDSFVFGVSKRDFDQPIVLGAEPVLVTGPIKVGDYIVTSDKQGHGQASKEPKMGSAIAQAMENGDGESYNIKAMIRKI